MYLGTWATAYCAQASGGSYIRTLVDGASVTIPFNGQNLDVIAAKGPTMGRARISVDGGVPVLVDLYSATLVNQVKVFTSGLLPAGLHTVKITRDVSSPVGSYINLDAVEVVGALAGTTRFEETNASLLWTGTWTNVYGYSHSARYIKTTNAAATITVNFNGAKINLIAAKARAYGKAWVTLDGGIPVLVDFYSSYTRYKQVVWTSGPLAAGNHKVIIEWANQKNPLATGTTIDLDAVDVVGVLE
jgi:hypothetical protein